MLALFVLLAQAVTPPPVTIQTRAVTPPAPLPAAPTAPTAFDVEVSAGGETLWRGRMRASSEMPASYNRTTVDAPPVACDGVSRFTTSYRTALALNLRVTNGRDASRFLFTMSWERPSPDRTCANLARQTSSREETFDADVGETHVMVADGGISVRLTRRQ